MRIFLDERKMMKLLAWAAKKHASEYQAYIEAKKEAEETKKAVEDVRALLKELNSKRAAANKKKQSSFNSLYYRLKDLCGDDINTDLLKAYIW